MVAVLNCMSDADVSFLLSENVARHQKKARNISLNNLSNLTNQCFS